MGAPPSSVHAQDALPVDAVIGDLLAALESASAAVLVAPPGAGKTTRVPLALLQASWRDDGRILVLEPRRLAARAAARHMAATLGEPVGETVGYRVRMESRVSARTRIEVITEGVFTRMILGDPELADVAAVLFDEFHERSLDLDLGLALALDVQGALRPDLRLLAMSATLDGGRVAALLGDAPVIASEGRQYPVDTTYISRNSGLSLDEDMAMAVARALRAETGSVLAFLPGRGEIERTARRLANRLPAGAALHTLYGALDPREQDAAIRPAPEGMRKVVLATAIAETSLTIDGVRVVVDCGFSRKPRFEPATGMTRLETVRVSRAAADQRRGRAGRTAPGVCYRLWDEPQTASLSPYDRPEILEADLAGFLLDLAAWGVADPAMLAFLDPPPVAAVAEARKLLETLGALDDEGRLTAEGKALQRLPLHPRLAHMVHRAGEGAFFSADAVATAARLAALMSEPGLGGRDADLRDRLRRLAREGGRAAKARSLADRWARMAGAKVLKPAAGAEEEAGALVALAYPDRIAEARGTFGHFRLANGRGARLEETDALARATFLAVAELQGSAEAARILSAAPLDRETIGALFGDRFETVHAATFDEASGTVRARRRITLGRVVIEERADPDPDPEAVTAALLSGVAARGVANLPWTPTLRRLRARVSFLRQSDETWPDLSDATLAATLADWLGPFVAGKTALSKIAADDLKAGLDGLLPYERARALDRLAPPALPLPTGHAAPIDYGAEAGPTVSVRVQELYGLADHPSVAGGRIPLVLELLSPAQRPIQVTRDLPGFWQGSWAEVRRDMRGRYPKHDWPQDPAAATAHRGARRRKP